MIRTWAILFAALLAGGMAARVALYVAAGIVIDVGCRFGWPPPLPVAALVIGLAFVLTCGWLVLPASLILALMARASAPRSMLFTGGVVAALLVEAVPFAGILANAGVPPMAIALRESAALLASGLLAGLLVGWVAARMPAPAAGPVRPWQVLPRRLATAAQAATLLLIVASAPALQAAAAASLRAERPWDARARGIAFPLGSEKGHWGRAAFLSSLAAVTWIRGRSWARREREETVRALILRGGEAT